MAKKKKKVIEKDNMEGGEPIEAVSEGSTSGIDTETMEIVPKKDWLINCPPTFIKQLKKDESATVPTKFVNGLRIEGVID